MWQEVDRYDRRLGREVQVSRRTKCALVFVFRELERSWREHLQEPELVGLELSGQVDALGLELEWAELLSAFWVWKKWIVRSLV